MRTPEHAAVEHARDFVGGHITERIPRRGRSSRSYVRQISIDPGTLEAQLMNASQRSTVEHARDPVGGHIGERIPRGGGSPGYVGQIGMDPGTLKAQLMHPSCNAP